MEQFIGRPARGPLPRSRRALLVGLLAVPGLVFAAPQPTAPEKSIGRKPAQVIADPAAFARELHAHGYKAKGGIDRVETDSSDERMRSFPHFTSSFTYQGVNYPYTMVGHPPASGRSTTLRSVIVPLRMNFVFFEQNPVIFEPDKAVNNIMNSPMYKEASFPNGVGQFGDQMQRATFWNKMDPAHRWHVRMDRPRVARTFDVLVEPDIGDLFLTAPPSDPNSMLIGDIKFGALDSTIHTVLQSIDIEPDEVPIFVTYNVSADVALGYHDAFSVGKADGTDVLQTLIYTSWLEPAAFGDLLADVSTFNHELAELLNDPYVNNVVPLWKYPPDSDPRSTCAQNPFLEVGDPEGNGATFDDFPTVPIPLNGYTYHLQDLVMLPWFTGEKPSSALNGWYDFPDTTLIKVPFVPCSP
jgi:hypothetical protein